jgi:hypothetical protein
MDKFLKIYEKLLKNKQGNNLIDILENIINKLEPPKNESYKRNIKYSTKDYICGIIEVLSNNISWRKYNGKIDGRILNNKHNYYSKLGVYDELYKVNLDTYLKSNKEYSKYLSMDSSFISNKNGINKLGRNIYYKNKQGRKITAIVDSKGISINVHLISGNKHDCKITPVILNKLENKDTNKNANKNTNKNANKNTNKDTKKNTKKNANENANINITENKIYLLADKGYDRKKIREIIKNKNMIPIIAKRKYTNKSRSLKNQK